MIAGSKHVIMVKDSSCHLQSSHEEAFARTQLIFPLRSKLVWCDVPDVSGDCKILHSNVKFSKCKISKINVLSPLGDLTTN